MSVGHPAIPPYLLVVAANVTSAFLVATFGTQEEYLPDVDACYPRGLGAGAASVSPPANQACSDRTTDPRDRQGNRRLGTHLRG